MKPTRWKTKNRGKLTANKTDQIDQINDIDQFRLSVLAGLD